MTRKNCLVETILGKDFAKAESSQGRSMVTDWSPNNIKTVIIGWKHLYIEYHVFNKKTQKHGIKSKLMVHTFNEKQLKEWEHKGTIFSLFETPRLLSAVEEIYLLKTQDYPANVFAKDLSDLNTFVHNERLKARFPRLRFAGCFSDTHEHIKTVIDSGRGTHKHYAKELKNLKIMYTNDDWWRYGDKGYAPLRPAFYTFDSCPGNANDLPESDMLLHRCFLETAKPFYEAEITNKALKKVQTVLEKKINELNIVCEGLPAYLDELVANAAVNDLLYQCNQKAYDGVHNPCLKIQAVADMTRTVYIWRRADMPKNFAAWKTEHSRNGEYAEDELYDKYKADFTHMFNKLEGVLENSGLYVNRAYKEFTDLLICLRFVLYPLLKAAYTKQTIKLNEAKSKAAFYMPKSAKYMNEKQHYYAGKITDWKAERKTGLNENMCEFIVQLCEDFCYAVVYSEFYSVHTEANIRLDNPNSIVANLMSNTDVYGSSAADALPERFMYYDTRLVRIANSFADLQGSGKYKTLGEYLSNIGPLKIVKNNGDVDTVVEHVTAKYNDNLSKALVCGGLRTLAMLVQSIQVENGVGLLPENAEQNYIQYVGKWHEMDNASFATMYHSGRNAVKNS